MLQKAKFIIYVFIQQFTQGPKEVLVRVASGPRAVIFSPVLQHGTNGLPYGQ
jgi:hypothetical protein